MPNTPPEQPTVPEEQDAQDNADDFLADADAFLASLDIPTTLPANSLSEQELDFIARHGMNSTPPPPTTAGVNRFLQHLCFYRLINCPVYPNILPDVPSHSDFYLCPLHSFLTQVVEPRLATPVWRSRVLKVRFRDPNEWNGVNMDLARDWLRNDLRLLPKTARQVVMEGMAGNDGGLRLGTMMEEDEEGKRSWDMLFDEGPMQEDEEEILKRSMTDAKSKSKGRGKGKRRER